MAWFRVKQDPEGKHFKQAKNRGDWAAELEAARKAPSDERPVRHPQAPRGGLVKRGGAPHVKRR